MQATKRHYTLKGRFAALLAGCGLLAGGLSGCYKETLPKEQDYMSKDMAYKLEVFKSNLGRTNLFTNIFNANFSTQPLEFTILDPRIDNKTPAKFLLDSVDTWQWKSYYSGEEKTIDEINAKRVKVRRPLLDIRKNSGEIIVWNTDSNKVRYGQYYFDVKVANKAGERIFKGLNLDLRRPKPYEPYDFDDATGQRLDPTKGGFIKPTDLNGHFDELRGVIIKDSVDVFFVKTGNARNTVTFKFAKRDSSFIPVSVFNRTRWDSLYYVSRMADRNVKFAFNGRIPQDSMSVTFDITNPFPVLADVANGDEMASIDFRFSRVHLGGRINGSVKLTFAILEPGEWTIVFKYRVNPKFEDD
ncbi:DUF5007 domain-containing protein [Chitinophaga lutea]